jgi:general stress protein YciG
MAEQGSVSNGSSGKSRRGFASMDPSRQKEIASKGGRAAHEKGTAHEWSSDEARSAGQKGGITVSRDRAHMAAIGREGGESRSRASRASREGGRAGMADRERTRPVSRETGRGASNGASANGASRAGNRDDARELA